MEGVDSFDVDPVGTVLNRLTQHTASFHKAVAEMTGISTASYYILPHFDTIIVSVHNHLACQRLVTSYKQVYLKINL